MAEPREWGRKVTLRMDYTLHERLVAASKDRATGWRPKSVSETIRDCIVAGIDVIDDGKFKLKKR